MLRRILTSALFLMLLAACRPVEAAQRVTTDVEVIAGTTIEPEGLREATSYP